MLLAIDTSAGTSVAVVDGGRVLAEAAEPGTRRHAEAIGTLLRAALDDAGIEPREVEAVVAGMGPGPFTGLRVGIAAARAFAFGVGVPVHPIVSHDAIAYGHEERVLVVTDARRREVAWSLYDAGVMRLEGPELCVRDGFDAITSRHPGVPVLDPPTMSAASLALVAELLLASGRPLGPAEPLYLRAPDVTMPGVPR
ncbi:tRNA (adenosine(37)-N6)-threonylcarbamoyltransferase complex dimerization subunit type 1 TsaB [Pseudolysinimonas yzui]|uniref:tRNA (Adenosine(37)-N6)-threonylcarbamoyltransferase complex dimerization subunit type 1 TsaB n=1 Tax=Pseudolysinimonas yzui TaxID=2708254 RepID=A0A8J3GRU3_9MICO|nr:tRNA (adenosine(37)-N6)-threonylcarbamoyltransferase complex dimerization subunit type 1 TsaB [Pseudolysinimonas yzui]GHF20486.1 tRNA (adenosine(37)-N6)-threonylcarbamoyltransferase complex dimerization subunit type 1 TsaB [Pseudolysinimonas yzui]